MHLHGEYHRIEVSSLYPLRRVGCWLNSLLVRAAVITGLRWYLLGFSIAELLLCSL